MNNKIVDIHVHVYPEHLSKKVVERLENRYDIKFVARPCLEDLLKSMKSSRISHSIIQPVSTSIGQVKPINDWLVDVVKKYSSKIGAFGTVYPGMSNYRKEIEKIKLGGLSGIKMHPNFQKFFPHEEIMSPIYQELIKNDLWVLFHSGYEIAPIEKIYAEIDSFLILRDKFPKLKIILAHMGGYKVWDEVEDKIIGKEFYLDLSYTMGFLSSDRIKLFIDKHGPDKIFFGSDFPVAPVKEQVDSFFRLELGKEIEDKILYLNAKKEILEG